MADRSAGFKRPEPVLVVVHVPGVAVLLLRRQQPPDFWQSVTGSLESGEDFKQAARRELLEETGIDGGTGLADTGVSNRYRILPAWRHRFAPGTEFNTEHVFSLSLDSPCEVQLNPAEHDLYRWLPPGTAVVRASSATDRRAIAMLQQAFLRRPGHP